jgi:hypothetical protein
MARREFLARLAALPFLAFGAKAAESKKPLKIMMKSAWGSDDPTRAADAATPVGWPPIGELRDKVVAKHIPVFACGVCSRARGITESDLATWNAKFGNPTIFVALVEWADRIITE